MDTTGCEPGEATDEAGSKSNAVEARLALLHAQALIKAGLKPQDVGIISGYAAQVPALLSACKPACWPAMSCLQTVLCTVGQIVCFLQCSQSCAAS